MITQQIAELACKTCGAPIILRQYEGIPDGWYSSGCPTKGCYPKTEDDLFDTVDVEKVARPLRESEI